MADEILRYEESSLHYVIEGHGSKNLLVFHGFGQNRNAFDTFAKSLSEDYKLYIFDLYFHGESRWGEGERPLEKSVWKKTMDRFLELHQMDKFSLCGFSLGGKFALATLEEFAEKVEEVILIAPDGIKTSFWYSLATYPLLFRRLFKSMVLHPTRFTALSKSLYGLGLMDKGLIRFAEHQMDTEDKRRRVYNSWVVFRHLTFDLKKMAALINRHSIRLIMITGKFDKVIRSENMGKLLGEVEKFRHEILETGHNGLINSAAAFLKNNSAKDVFHP
jgi:pimeloyl-ACP methyl ester carboxylesterase